MISLKIYIKWNEAILLYWKRFNVAGPGKDSIALYRKSFTVAILGKGTILLPEESFNVAMRRSYCVALEKLECVFCREKNI